MDQQPLPRFLCHWENLESARWQEVSSDVKGCLSGRERKFLNGDLLLLLFITVPFTDGKGVKTAVVDRLFIDFLWLIICLEQAVEYNYVLLFHFIWVYLMYFHVLILIKSVWPRYTVYPCVKSLARSKRQTMGNDVSVLSSADRHIRMNYIYKAVS